MTAPVLIASRAMNWKLPKLLASTLLAVFLSGCVTTLDGDLKTAMPFVTDQIVSRYERAPQVVIDAVKKTLAHNGVITSENTLSGVISARVDTRYVWVKIEKVGDNISQVTVQVRTKWRDSDLVTASDIDKQIALNLK